MSEDLVRLRIADGPPPKELWAPPASQDRAGRAAPGAAARLRHTATIDWRGLYVTALLVFVIIAIWSVVP